MGITIAVRPKPVGVYRTCDLCFDTTCWESRLSLYQNPQVLVNDCITRDKDPREEVIPCHETHGERWFIQCPTKMYFEFPITVGPFTINNKAFSQIIDRLLACYNFEYDEACHYDPHHIILAKRMKLRRVEYKHQGSS